MPFLALPFLEIPKWPKKEIFSVLRDRGHGARMHPYHISRAHFGHPRRADTCRDSLSGHISASVNAGRVPPETPRDMIGAHTGSMSPIRGWAKNFLFWHLFFLEISNVQKRQFLGLPQMGGMEPVCPPLISPEMILGTPVGLTHAEIA